MNMKYLVYLALTTCMVFGSAAGYSASASTLPESRKLTSAELYSQFKNPDNRYRPFVRWWWNGDRVEAEELIRELHLLKEAGIAGVEINPISFPGKEEQAVGHKALTWLSDEWIEMLQTVFDEAKKLDMTCDLIVGSGWPFGSETLPREDCASVMLTLATPVKGGSLYETSLYSIFKTVDPGVTDVNPRRTPELVSMLLAPDPINDLSEAIDVTDRIKDGVLRMDIPEGKWQLYSMVKYNSFACVINGAPGAAGSILDHMDAKAVRGYLDNMSRTIEAKTGPLSKHLRAFFVDSMELEGCNWTDDFADAFRERCGYDLMPWLPFTMFKVGRLGNVESFQYGCKQGPEFKEQVDRVRFDFELTKCWLLHERYTETFLKWCRDNDVKSRAQTYGRGFFPLETALGYDIPEGESWTTNYLRHRLGEEMGDEDYRRGRGYTMINKYVSSAAHLSGKRLVSAEEMTNTYKVFSTSLEFLKVGSDMSAISGTTHSVWHGFNYSPQDAPYPGWIQYGSFYNENNTWWPYFHLLNDYRARMSSILQNADLYTDIAILPANYDMWTTMGVPTDPFPTDLNVRYTSLIWEAIHKCGGGADYVTEIVLDGTKVKNGKLCYGPKAYGTIILPDVTSTTPQTLKTLLEFVKTGGRVFCIGQYPSKSVGFKDFETRDAEIKDLVEQLKAYPKNFVLLEKPSDGRYLEWYEDVMARYDMPHVVTVGNPDRFLLQNHYVTDDKSDVFLFVNAHMSEARETELSFPSSVTSGKTAWIYDPGTGNRWRLRMKNGKVNMRFGPSESYLIVFNRENGGAYWNPLPVKGEATRELCDWGVSLTHYHEGWTKEMNMKGGLKDLKDTDFKNFMGDATYTAKVNFTKTSLPRFINLGKVAEICTLTVNGVDCGTKWYGERIYDISGLVHEGENTIEVKVNTLMCNYLLSQPDNTATKRFLTRRNQGLISAGLLGPVKVYR